MLRKFVSSLNRDMPAVTFGGAALSGEGGGYGFGSLSETEAETIVRASWDSGITAFDTAPIYGFGLSEERLGRYLPKDAFLITKCGVDWHPTKRVNMTNAPEVVERMLHESLRRLKREFIDLYMVHWPDPRIDMRATLAPLIKAKEAGKIRHLGLCNTTESDLKKAGEVTQIVAIQSELNLFQHKAFTDLGDIWRPLFSMGWGTFDKGILTGRVTPERKFSKEDCRSWAPWWKKKEVEKKISRTEELRKILGDYDVSLQAFCLQYNLEFIGLSSVLVGMKSVSDLAQVCGSLQSKLTRERMGEILSRWTSMDSEKNSLP